MNDEVSPLSAGINLVPQTIKKPQQARHALVVAVMVLRYTLVLVGVVGLGLVAYQTYLSVNIQNATEDIADHVEYIESKKEFQEDFVALQSYASALGGTLNKLSSQVGVFEVLEQITPSIIVLSDLTINDEGIRIAGNTPEYPAITDYFNQLVASDKFDNVQIVNITRPTEQESDAKIQFTISFETK